MNLQPVAIEETRGEGTEPKPNMGEPTAGARAIGSGPRGEVVDAEFKETR